MSRSFFERLTGSVRLNDNEDSVAPQPKAAPAQVRTRTRAPRPDEAMPTVIHPTIEERALPASAAEEAPVQEGQLTLDIYDDGANIVIQSTVAGVKPEDIDISLQEDTLTIRGSRKRAQEVNEDNFYYRELYWGTFSRAVILPEEVDFQKADAVIKNGLLSIKLPKKDRSQKKITVKVG